MFAVVHSVLGAMLPLNEERCDGKICDVAMDEMLSRVTMPPQACSGSDILLAFGVLTLPKLVRTPQLRGYHRAAHYAQAPVRRGSVCMRYLVTEPELSRLVDTDRRDFNKENSTYGDMLSLPAVPHGPLRQRLPALWSGASRVRDAPVGAGCVLKILSWLQYASRVLPSAPFVACIGTAGLDPGRACPASRLPATPGRACPASRLPRAARDCSDRRPFEPRCGQMPTTTPSLR